MTTKTMKYVNESLAACGFCVLNSAVAMRVRSDIWTTGVECASDFGRKELTAKLNNLPGVTRFTGQLEGISRNVLVLSRSPDFLAQRIGWVTGYSVLQLLPEGHYLPAPSGQTEATMQRWSEPTTDDRFSGITTKEPGRTCGTCQHMTAGHNCSVAEISGLEHPAGGTWRRCLGYTPTREQYDSRTGVQLWPELVAA